MKKQTIKNVIGACYVPLILTAIIVAILRLSYTITIEFVIDLSKEFYEDYLIRVNDFLKQKKEGS